MNTRSTIGKVHIAALFIALGLTIAVNGSTLALFDNLAHADQTTTSTAAVALETVTITAKRI